MRNIISWRNSSAVEPLGIFDRTVGRYNSIIHPLSTRRRRTVHKTYYYHTYYIDLRYEVSLPNAVFHIYAKLKPQKTMLWCIHDVYCVTDTNTHRHTAIYRHTRSHKDFWACIVFYEFIKRGGGERRPWNFCVSCIIN